ncbi:MAG: hypothetical protein V4640_00355 [Verrucomicrobiota bacterium]
MSPIVPLPALAWIAASLILPIQAQDLGRSIVRDESSPAGFSEPSREFTPSESLRAKSLLESPAPAIGVQDMRTLEFGLPAPPRSGPRAALDALRVPTIHRHFVKEEASANSSHLRDELKLVSAAYREPAKAGNQFPCDQVALAVNRRITLDPSSLLEVVAAEVAANPHCCCEIVKSSIQTIEADPILVVEIVDAAIQSSPEHMRLISQCAIAMAPEALSAVQAHLAKLDPQGGDADSSAKSTAKSAKSAKSAKGNTGEIAQIVNSELDLNPLDLPPNLVAIPPPIIPPPITRVDP